GPKLPASPRQWTEQTCSNSSKSQTLRKLGGMVVSPHHRVQVWKRIYPSTKPTATLSDPQPDRLVGAARTTRRLTAQAKSRAQPADWRNRPGVVLRPVQKVAAAVPEHSSLGVAASRRNGACKE